MNYFLQLFSMLHRQCLQYFRNQNYCSFAYITSDFDVLYSHSIIRGGSRAADRSKMERFVIIVNGFQITVLIILN